jgi:hypothetical protein
VSVQDSRTIRNSDGPERSDDFIEDLQGLRDGHDDGAQERCCAGIEFIMTERILGKRIACIKPVSGIQVDGKRLIRPCSPSSTACRS